MPRTIPLVSLVAALICTPLHAAQDDNDRYPGYGVVESVTPLVPAAKKPAEESATAGSSAATGSSAPARRMYRVRVRMDDGRVQTRDVPKPPVSSGDRVLLTNSGDVVPD